MRITFAYNQRREEGEEQAELLTQENVESLLELLRTLPYEITPVEVSGPTDKMVADLLASRPDLIFNVAKGPRASPARLSTRPYIVTSACLLPAADPPCCWLIWTSVWPIRSCPCKGLRCRRGRSSRRETLSCRRTSGIP